MLLVEKSKVNDFLAVIIFLELTPIYRIAGLALGKWDAFFSKC